MLEQQEGLHPVVRGVLGAAGDIGSGTISAPPPSLEDELGVVTDTGGPRHGAGAAAALGGLQLPTAPGEEPIRWDQRLPPGFRRGAPEIYVSMRSSGASSVRDWLRTSFTGARVGPQWKDLWTTATAVGYQIARAPRRQRC